jgi:anti-anti-sigma regulatory factor
MYLEHKHVTGDGSEAGSAVPPGSRNAARCSSRARLELARLQPPARGYPTGGEGAAAGGREPRALAALAVRRERRAGTLILWLSGTLSRTTSRLLDREITIPGVRPMRLVVDLTGLAFIDSAGRDTLVRIRNRASLSGERLCFRHGPHVSQQPLELTRNRQLWPRPMSRRADVSDEDSYFALAMACADVDHSRPGDRPGGTLNRFPTPAAGASDALSPPSVARAAPPRKALS